MPLFVHLLLAQLYVLTILHKEKNERIYISRRQISDSRPNVPRHTHRGAHIKFKTETQSSVKIMIKQMGLEFRFENNQRC